ncbi:MAG: hypothetical protein ACE5E1_03015, partial [Phycisphaerae bacterium]
MRRHCPHLILTAALLTLIGPGPLQGEEPQPSIDIVGEQLDPSNFGPGIVEGMDAVLARERARAKQKPTNPKARNGRHGTWFVPSRRATFFPASGSNNVVNKWGDTKMGIAFPSATDVYGACFAGQGGGPAVWAKGIRVHGYRDGKLVGTTDWFTEITDAPTHFDINLLGVDRIVIEAKPARDGSGWYGMDDFVFGRQALDGSGRYETVTLDFEDLNRPAKLTGSNYAGLIWESGTGEIPESQTRPEDNIIPAPIPRTRLAGEPADSEPDQAGAPRGTPNPPTLALDFEGVDRDDLNQFSAPPDTCGAVGPNHFVEVVNTVWAVYNKSGTLVMWSSLSSFLPGSSGDPRVLYDQHSGRWVVIVSDFSSRIYLAVSTTNDPTGSWFKTNVVVSTGSDSGCFPDYPTLGVDQNGIYVSSFMAGCGMSIFAFDKAPLIAGSPSLGTVTAFRGFGFEGAIQPVHTYGTPSGEYFISRNSSSSLRLRRINPPLTSPSLSDLGAVSVPSFAFPPDAPVLGSSTPLDTVGDRLMNAVYRDGFIWTAHTISVSGRAACRWYQINTSPQGLTQSGTVSDSSLYYFFPTIAVNAIGDVVMGFSGSNSSQFAACYFTGRRFSDATGAMATPILLQAGAASQNIIDGFGRNRWGDYSLTSLDPTDETAMWTVQEYAKLTNIWGTRIGKVFVEQPDCNGNGIPDACDIDCGITGGFCD